MEWPPRDGRQGGQGVGPLPGAGSGVPLPVHLCLCGGSSETDRKYRNERRMMQIAREVVREELERHREGKKTKR